MTHIFPIAAVAKSEREYRKVERELEGCTFSPDINSRSRSPVGESPENPGERLYKQAEERRQRRLKAEIDAKLREEVACSFKPSVNEKRGGGRRADGSGSDTFERLYSHAEEQRQAKEMREQSVEHTFQPEINERSRGVCFCSHLTISSSYFSSSAVLFLLSFSELTNLFFLFIIFFFFFFVF